MRDFPGGDGNRRYSPDGACRRPSQVTKSRSIQMYLEGNSLTTLAGD